MTLVVEQKRLLGLGERVFIVPLYFALVLLNLELFALRLCIFLRQE